MPHAIGAGGRGAGGQAGNVVLGRGRDRQKGSLRTPLSRESHKSRGLLVSSTTICCILDCLESSLVSTSKEIVSCEHTMAGTLTTSCGLVPNMEKHIAQLAPLPDEKISFRATKITAVRNRGGWFARRHYHLRL